MQIEQHSFLVTGGASGLGEAVVRAIVAQGGKVVIADLNESAGQALTDELGANSRFVRCDITKARRKQQGICRASLWRSARLYQLCGHCGGTKATDRKPTCRSEAFSRGVHINLVGSFNVARLVALASLSVWQLALTHQTQTTVLSSIPPLSPPLMDKLGKPAIHHQKLGWSG